MNPLAARAQEDLKFATGTFARANAEGTPRNTGGKTGGTFV